MRKRVRWFQSLSQSGASCFFHAWGISFANFVEGKHFSKLDLRQAYHQVEVSEESNSNLAITTHKRLVFDKTSNPSIWQRALNLAPSSSSMIWLLRTKPIKSIWKIQAESGKQGREEEEVAEISGGLVRSASTTPMLISYYKENPILWGKRLKEHGNKTKKGMAPFIAWFEKANPQGLHKTWRRNGTVWGAQCCDTWKSRRREKTLK